MRVPVSDMAVQMTKRVVPEAQGPLSAQTIQSQTKGARNSRMRGWWLLFFSSAATVVFSKDCGFNDALKEIINTFLSIIHNVWRGGNEAGSVRSDYITNSILLQL